MDQRACEPKYPEFGYSGAEFPRAYARIPKPVNTGVENATKLDRLNTPWAIGNMDAK